MKAVIRIRQRLDERRWAAYTRNPRSPAIFYHWQPSLGTPRK